jgi:hypothetical protein
MLAICTYPALSNKQRLARMACPPHTLFYFLSHQLLSTNVGLSHIRYLFPHHAVAFIIFHIHRAPLKTCLLSVLLLGKSVTQFADGMLAYSTHPIAPKHSIASVARPVDTHPDRPVNPGHFLIWTVGGEQVGREGNVEACYHPPRAVGVNICVRGHLDRWFFSGCSWPRRDGVSLDRCRDRSLDRCGRRNARRRL